MFTKERRGRVWRGEGEYGEERESVEKGEYGEERESVEKGECGEERESVWVCIVRKEDGFWGRDACLSKTVSS